MIRYIMFLGERMKKYLLGFIIFLLLIISIIIIINKRRIIGKWKAVDTEYEYYYIFNKDNTCSYEMTGARLECTYEETKNDLIILYNGNDKKHTYKYSFKGKYLIIRDNTGKDNKFIKQ